MISWSLADYYRTPGDISKRTNLISFILQSLIQQPPMPGIIRLLETRKSFLQFEGKRERLISWKSGILFLLSSMYVSLHCITFLAEIFLNRISREQELSPWTSELTLKNRFCVLPIILLSRVFTNLVREGVLFR